MKIEKGKHYECVYPVVLDNNLVFRSGTVYKCNANGYIENELGNEHLITNSQLEYFRENKATEPETRPSHYGGDTNPHEPIKIIQHYGLSFELGNVIKYVLRSDKKGQRESDLKKAMQYLQFELNKLNK